MREELKKEALQVKEWDRVAIHSFCMEAEHTNMVDLIARQDAYIDELQEKLSNIKKELDECDEHGSVLWTNQVRRFL